MEKTTNVLLVGVGGQGIISSSDVLADMALSSGFDVKKSEIHGMSQRGGVVYSYIRFGEKIYSPVPEDGEIDYLAAFEKMEALRWAGHLSKKGRMVINELEIAPVSLKTMNLEYPHVKTALNGRNAVYVNGPEICKKLGSEKYISSVMTGAVSLFLGFSDESFKKSFARIINKKNEENYEAYLQGKESVK
ncbi:MAG TPA: indolepyruvate oxidoreductase subunit beta [Firmicutes bacterium]|nr:indolepyruvate oxidoreductase subunit beta [Bacillota bacterium]